MKIFFGIAAILITLYTGGRYIPDIFVDKIKPHAFSWLPWTILTGVAFIIQMQNGEDIWGFGALAASTLVCAIIFILSLKYGEKNITHGDTVSLTLCLILIVFWLGIKDDIGALILVCGIDALAFFPTWRKSWRKPKEENISMYSLSSLKSLLSLFSLEKFAVTSWLYPVFLVFINLAFAFYLVWRKKIMKK